MNQITFIELLGLLIDFGLVVLIWMVQLIVYPSFLEYTKNDLLRWHHMYTQRLAIIVIPLMLGQLSFNVYQLFSQQTAYTITSFLAVSFLWVITLFVFAPMHQKIANGTWDKEFLCSLVKRNWIRTLVWTALFLLSVSHVIFSTYLD